jgi:hypothetical protein
MAAIARIYGDWDGSLVTGGTTTAYTLTTNSTHAALADQSLLIFRINAANTGSCTLNVDSLGAKTMKLHSNNLASGDLKANEIIAACYNATNDVYDVWVPLTVPQGLDTTDSPTFAALTLTTALTYANGGWAACADNTIKGLTLSNGTDADHDIDVVAGSCLDNDKDTVMTVGALTKQIDASWVTGTNQGGLTSSLTVANNTWYHVFVVVVSGTADVMFDTSVTCANGVTDHTVTQFRRIGSVKTDGSANIVAFIQNGNKFVWDVPVQDVSTLNPGTSAITPTLTTPLGVKVESIINVGAISGTSTTRHLLFTDPAQTDTAPSATVYHQIMGGATDDSYGSQTHLVYTNTSSQIRYRLGPTSVAGTEVEINTVGWYDLRGQ